MVDCLIFSKDRAAQLDLLLRSIDRYASKLYSSLTVLWEASAPEYERGYRKLIADKQRVEASFWREYDFEKQVRWWLNHWTPTTGEPLISFLVDDDVFYRDCTYVPGAASVSFRGGDYTYPFSLDGVIYRAHWIRDLLAGLTFRNPTELEAVGHDHRDRLPFTRLIEGPTCLTGLPWNRVSTSSGMPHRGPHEFDLNERYLAGERLAVPTFDLPQPPHTVNLQPVYESASALVPAP